eukprot:6513213-Alexandrium_andersonii.AAC.1
MALAAMRLMRSSGGCDDEAASMASWEPTQPGGPGPQWRRRTAPGERPRGMTAYAQRVARSSWQTAAP